MSDSRVGILGVGYKFNTKDIESTKRVRCCEHTKTRQSFCGECGKPMWGAEKIQIEMLQDGYELVKRYLGFPYDKNKTDVTFLFGFFYRVVDWKVNEFCSKVDIEKLSKITEADIQRMYVEYPINWTKGEFGIWLTTD